MYTSEKSRADGEKCIYIFCGLSREFVGRRLGGGKTVPGDRVLFMLMSITVGEDLYRLLCVLYSPRSDPAREEKEKEKKSYNCSMYGWGTVGRVQITNNGLFEMVNLSPFFCLLGKSERR